MATASISLRVAALKLQCGNSAVLDKLRDHPELLIQKFGVVSGDQLVLRDGRIRTLLNSEGRVISEDRVKDPPQRVPAIKSGVNIVREKPSDIPNLDKLASSTLAQEEFVRRFPEMESHLAKYLRQTGCGTCRAPVVLLLQSDDIRVQDYLHYLEDLDA